MAKKKKMCTCGKSKTPPYCDESHVHFEEAVDLIINKLKTRRPCTCGKSKNGPYCDDSHEQVEELLKKLIKIKSNIHKEEKGDFDF
jgi:CDGSH-type Zn-finger protein